MVRMKRSRMWMGLGCAVALLFGFRCGAADGPNILVILADDLGYADVGFQGCKDIPTPHLDRLAKSGIRCTDGYVSHPFCSPTRAGLMTGRYQQRFGHENNPKWLPEDTVAGLPLTEETLPQLMKKAGYITGMVGKWHLGAHPQFHPCARGYDEYFGLRGGGHDYFEHNLFKSEPEKAEATEYKIPLHRNREPVEESEYLTDAFGREAAAFVSRHKGERWFLYLAFNAPHTPLQAPQVYLDRVKGIAGEKRRTYGAMVCAMDDAVGRTMDAVRESGREKDTLVFFFSDNGGPVTVTEASNAPLRGAKGDVHEGGIRVPFLVSWPGVLQPGEYGQPVCSIDVLATSIALAGVPEPGKALDGVNILPFLKGERPGMPHERLFWRTGGGSTYAVREGSWKLVCPKDGQPALYDLSKDIGESEDLAAARPEKLEELLKAYRGWDAELIQPIFQSPRSGKKAAKKK